MRKVTVTIPVPTINNRATRAALAVPMTAVRKVQSVSPVRSTKLRYAEHKANKTLPEELQSPELEQVDETFKALMTFDFSDGSPEAMQAAQNYLNACAAFGAFLGKLNNPKLMLQGTKHVQRQESVAKARATKEELRIAEMQVAAGLYQGMVNEAWSA